VLALGVKLTVPYSKKDLLAKPIEHIDITKLEPTSFVDSMGSMGFTSREVSNAAQIFVDMINDESCTVILTIAGSTSAAGCMKIYSDLIKYNLVDVVVATGASIVDMDFFEALGFRHYVREFEVPDDTLRDLYIDRIYDTYIDEEQLQVCDSVVRDIANSIGEGVLSSREFIVEMGRYLEKSGKKEDSLVLQAYKNQVPVFCPAFSDSSAGFGLVLHQAERPEKHVSIDSVKDLRELTAVKIASENSGLMMIGGGAPKNFAQDTVICAETQGIEVPMHKYAVQITVADVRDGACSSSTLSEAQSWGKVSLSHQQMVFAEATSVLPLIASYAYHNTSWSSRKRKRLSAIL